MPALTTGALLAAIAGVLFWVDPGWCTAPELAKRGFLWAAALVLAGAWLRQRPKALARPWAIALLAADLAMHGVSALGALHPTLAWLGGSERGLGVIDAAAWCALTVAAAQLLAVDARAFHAIIRGAVGLVCGLAVLSLLQAPLHWPGGLPDAFAGRAYATLGNPGFLAGVLALTLPLVVGRVMRLPLALVVGVLLAAALWVTGSRGAMLAALVGMGATAVLSCRSRRAQLALLCAASLVAAAGGWLVFRQIDRSDSLAIRASLYRAAISTYVQPLELVDRDGHADPLAQWRRWLGYGPEGIEPVLTRQREASLNGLEAQGWDRLADRTHSRVLDRWIELGLPGVLLGLALALLPLLRGLTLAWRAAAPDQTGADPMPSYMAIACGCWLAFGVDGLFGVPSAAVDLGAALVLAVLIAPVPDFARRRVLFKPAALGFALVLALGLTAGVVHRLWLRPAAAAAELPAATAAALSLQPYSALPAIYALEHLQRASLAGADEIDVARWLPLAEHAVRAAPSLPRAWHLLGWLRQRAGDDRGAQLADAQALQLLAAVPLTAERLLSAASANIRTAEIVQSTDAAAAQRALATARGQMERIAKAARGANWYRSYAYLRARQGALAAAITAYREALRLAPEDQVSRRNLLQLQTLLEAEPGEVAAPPDAN